jgi:hypothetical protein
MAALINETSASDGDIFPARFKKAGLGPLIGKRTWGGVVGISGRGPLLDGGKVFVPQQATNDVDGAYILEGDPGVATRHRRSRTTRPRSGRRTRPAARERAVAEVLKAIEKDPKVLPKKPADPVCPGRRSSPGGAEAGQAVEPVIRLRRQGRGPVVDVKQNRVVRALALADEARDVADANGDARIRQGRPVEPGHLAAIPCDDLGNELGDLDRGARADAREHRGERVTHAEATDENTGVRRVREPVARRVGERLLGAVDAAVHQLGRPDADRVLLTTTVQPQLAAVAGDRRRSEVDPGNHRAMVTGNDES